MICVTIGRGRHSSLAEEWKAAADAGVELVELRIDCLRREPDLKRRTTGELQKTHGVVSCLANRARRRATSALTAPSATPPTAAAATTVPVLVVLDDSGR